ncbi:major facilitator family transporter [Legionella spiritensis]|nr:major facilitator family transporter [Legionella spiritensis]
MPNRDDEVLICMSRDGQKYAWFIFLLAAAFCAYEYILRVKLSPLSHQLLTEFNCSANAFGLLSSAFFYGYAPVQILSGPIIQRFGPRMVLTCALFLCVAATLLFAASHDFKILFGLRLLVGVGSGFAFIGAYILIANWFPIRKWAFLYGLLQFIACLGAMYGQQFLAFLSENITWRALSVLFGYVGIGLTILFYFFLRDTPKNPVNYSKTSSGNDTLLAQLKTVSLNPRSYPVVLYALFSWGPITISATLWGPAFLAEKLSFSIQNATYLFSYTWLGIAIGSPCIGYLANRVNRPKNLMLLCSGAGFIASLLLLNGHLYSTASYKVILFFLGFSTAAQPISFVKIQQANPEHCRGVAVGFNNTAVILSGAFLQPLSSYLIERSYLLNTAGNLSYHYTLTNYYNGLVLMPVSIIISFILAMFFIKEKQFSRQPVKHTSTYSY